MNRLLVIAMMTLASCGGAATSGASSPSSSSSPAATTASTSTNPASATSAQLPTTTLPIDLKMGLACFDLSKVDFRSHVAMRSGSLKLGPAFDQFYESAHALAATITATCPSPLTFEGHFDEYGIVVSGGITVFPGSFMNVDIPDAASQPYVQTALLLAASALTDNAADASALAREALLARGRLASGPSCGAVGVALRTYAVREAKTDADGTSIRFSAC